MTRVILHPAAQAELSEAAERYDEQVSGLGERFLRRAEEAVRFIETHPEGAPLVEGAVRGKVVQRFPFTLFYSLETSGILVLAIAHHKRRPGYWRSRRGGR